MKTLLELVLTITGMGFTTAGLIVMIEHRVAWPILLVLVGIFSLFQSVEVYDEV